MPIQLPHYSEENSYVFFTERPRGFQASSAEKSPSTARSDGPIFALTSTRNAIRLLTETVDDFIRFSFSRVPEVNRILVKQESDVCHVWIFVDRFAEDVLDKVCDQEELVIDEFSHSHFDFKVIYQPAEKDRNTDALGSSRQIYIRNGR